jgi:hypothetical protein
MSDNPTQAGPPIKVSEASNLLAQAIIANLDDNVLPEVAVRQAMYLIDRAVKAHVTVLVYKHFGGGVG